MPNLNKVMLMGNLTRDPELRYLPSNTPVVSIGLAINERWKDRESGQQQERTNFIDCEAFGRTAEVLNQYLKKGRPVFIEGKLRLDQWQDKEGNNRSKLKVVIDGFQFIDSRGDDAADSSGNYSRNSSQRSQAPAANNQSAASPGPDPHAPVGNDDIPF